MAPPRTSIDSATPGGHDPSREADAGADDEIALPAVTRGGSRVSGDAGTAPPDLVRTIRRDLAAGRYYPRERLVEADLAGRYGTTRAAVREALIQLTAEGFVETEANRGARVRPMSIGEAIEIAEVRRALESLCASRASELATDEERLRIVELAAALRRASEEGRVTDYLDINARFHSLIYEMSHHATARRILENFQHRPIDRFIPGVFRNRPPKRSIESHETIADAIAEGDASRAERSTFEHLTYLIEDLHRYEAIAG